MVAATTQKRLLVPLIWVALACSACASGLAIPTRQQEEDHFYQNFQTAVASVSGDGYDVYWLGRTVQVSGGGVLNPEFGDFAYDAKPSRFSYDYYGTGLAGISLVIYPRDAWPAARAKQVAALRADRSAAPLLIEHAEVAGEAAEVWIASAPNRPVNHIFVIVDFGETIVECDTASLPAPGTVTPPNLSPTEYFGIAKTPSSTPLPDLNPFINLPTFLAVLQHLRPYPQ